MKEIIALEEEIRAGLPQLDKAAARDPKLRPALRDAHAVMCNGWQGPGLRLDRLREIVAAMKTGGP